MDLLIKNQLFLVTGATSGFGQAVAEALAQEGAYIICAARGEEKLKALQLKFPAQIEVLALDATAPESIDIILQTVGKRQLHGAFINAGGPPAMPTMETTLKDWDQAYNQLLRWKVAIAQALIPSMINNKYGKMVFSESSSVKQPLENLVLSNSLRLAVVGMVKTLSQEVARHGITLNILAPGSHNTPAIDRIYKKKSEQTGIDFNTVKVNAIQQIPVGFLGEASDFSTLAIWLLSPFSRFVTGQTFTVDGGMIKGIF